MRGFSQVESLRRAHPPFSWRFSSPRSLKRGLTPTICVQADLMRRTLLNAAGCLLQLHLPAQAEEACTQVLDAHPRSAKALYRRSMARVAMGKWLEAEEDVRLALGEQSHSNSPALLALLRKVSLPSLPASHSSSSSLLIPSSSSILSCSSS
jgi:tetratricopeptide (TPR) repeat protein